MANRSKRRRGSVVRRRVVTPVTYRDKRSGRFVSESTWKRSKARGGTRYVRLGGKTRHRKGRELSILGFDGYVPVAVRSSKTAKLASKHLNAVGRFLRTGDAEQLGPFIGKRVGGVELLTDADRLQILASADLVKLDALYRNSSARGRKK